ncbi:MAG: ATP-binding cassette domain-containing protein [Clostridiales bacterium]|nr:ATP-binding cassette domain-containing protein [Clostridiales bacterium]
MKMELRNIEKSFGQKKVLENVSFSAEGGRALGFLGRNGAGKTTAIRIIMGIFLQDSGQVLVDGAPIAQSTARIGYMPEERGLYPKKKIWEQIVYIGELRGLTAPQSKKRAEFLLDKLEASEYIDKRLDTLSKGNQQKIQLAIALIHDPEIVILDEPFSGLDPINAAILKRTVEELVGYGKIVMFSSHQMGYVEEFCRDICILDKGAIVLSGDLDQIKKSYPRSRIRVVPAGVPEAFRERLKTAPFSNILEDVTEERGAFFLKLRAAKDKRALLAALSDFDVDSFLVLEPTLEEIFLEKAGNQNEAV